MNKEEIRTRILNNLNIPVVNMYYFLDITEIKFTNKVKSAAITCENKPVLLINEDFVNKYCKKDEHLLMLVMHEMYHYILGHTSLARGGGEIDNIVFDAIINATLSKMFHSKECDEFFYSINPTSTFPGCLLHRPTGKEDKKYQNVLHFLYKTDTCTYKEIYDLFKGEKLNYYFLLGEHTGDNIFNKLGEDYITKLNKNGVYDSVAKNFGEGFDVHTTKLPYDSLNDEKYTKVASFLKKVVVRANHNPAIGPSKTRTKQVKETFLPSLKDRYLLTKKKFFDDVLIHKTTYLKERTEMDLLNKTLVYLDVSGSFCNELKCLVPILIKLERNNLIELYQFSTKVFDLKLKDLKNGELKSTGGTDLNPVLNEIFTKKKNYNSAVIITDGYIPPIKPKYYKLIKDTKFNLYTITNNTDAKTLFNVSKDKLLIDLY